MTSTTQPGPQQQPRQRRWSRPLTVHLAVVVVALAACAVVLAARLETAGQVAVGVLTLLGLPWSELLTLGYVDLGPVDRVWSAAPFLLPLANVGVHWLLLVTVRSSRERRAAVAAPAPTTAAATAPRRRPPTSRVLVFGACALLGAGVWGAWLGWDTSYYTTPDVPHPQGPYTPEQVVGCAITVGLVTALLSRWRNPVAVAGGVGFGFWVVWSAEAAVGPMSGPLWPVGSFLLLCGLAAGTSVSAFIGFATRRDHVLGSVATAREARTSADEDRWRTGTALVVVAGSWLLLGTVVRHAFPLTWTFLQLLHVPLDLLAAVAAVIGVLWAVAAVRRRRALGHDLRPLAPVGVSCAVLLAVVLVGRVLPADDGYSGQVGVMAGPDGSLVAVLGVCAGSVDAVVVEDLDSDLADRAWDRGETAYAAQLEHDDALTGVVQVDLADPPAGWSGTPLREPAAGQGELNISATGPGWLLNDTYFTREAVRQLPPGMVLVSVWDRATESYSGNEQQPLADFADTACSGRGRYA